MTVVVTTDVGFENTLLSIVVVEHSSPQERAGCRVAEDAEDAVDVERAGFTVAEDAEDAVVKPCITICAGDKIDFLTSLGLIGNLVQRHSL